MPPLVLIAVAWMAGLALAHHWLVPAGHELLPLVLLTIIPLAALLFWRETRSVRVGAICALFFLLGGLWYQIRSPDLRDPSFVACHNERGWATFEGVVRGYPRVDDDRTKLEVDTEKIQVEGQWQPVHGTVLVQVPRFPEFRYGDRLRISGLLETPPVFEGFSYRDYLAQQGIYSVVWRAQVKQLAEGQGSLFWQALFAAKDRARDVIARLIPDPEASLLQGIVLGIESGIPEDLYDDYNATGASHIIVISGANLIVVAALFSRSFGRLLGRRRAYWFTIGGIALYVLLVGADAAVVRAGVMACLVVTASLVGRHSTAYVSIFSAAIVLTAINPQTLWNLGFQLSFAAALGLILLTLPIETVLQNVLTRIVSTDAVRLTLSYLNDALIVTLSALVFTTPLILHAYGRLSLAAPVTNLLIQPVQPFIMSWGGAATLLGLIPLLEPIARVVAWVPWLCLAYTNAVVQSLAAWPLASLEVGRIGSAWLVLFYGMVLTAVWVARRRMRLVQRFGVGSAGGRSLALAVGLPLAVVTLVGLAVLQLPDGRLHVAFLDVGQGDAVLITTHNGTQILVDGGPSPTALATALGREMPFWDRSIDLLVMTHADADHITGLVEVLNRFRVGGWMDNGRTTDSPIYSQCQALLEDAHVPRHVAVPGESLDLGNGLFLEVLHPPPGTAIDPDGDSNNDSIVLRVVWERVSFLLTGDLEAEGEHLLVGSHRTVAADVLKVAHHGSGGSSTAEFLSAVSPRYAVISVGADNSYGHPQPAVLDRLSQLGDVMILRTDQEGTIEFVTDDERLWIYTTR